jgi:tetratricopeptide (TPR) repeat protein
VDPVHDKYLFTLSDRSSTQEGLLDLLDRLSEKARRELHEDPAELAGSRVALGEATTRSLDAYQHYTAGMETWLRDGQRAMGLKELEEAVRLDPQFAAAHAQIALILEGVYGRPDLARSHRKTALELVDRMPEKERTLFQLELAAEDTGAEPTPKGLAEGSRLAEELLRRFPDDKVVLVSVAQAFGQLRVRDRVPALLRQAIELDPGYRFAVNFQLNRLVSKPGNEAEALARTRRAVATRRSAANLILLAEALAYAGDLPAAAAAAREGLALDTGSGVSTAGDACKVLRAAGASAECLRAFERILSDGLNAFERDKARLDVVAELCLRGRVREAIERASVVEEARLGGPGFLLGLHQVGRSRLDAPEAVRYARRLEWKPARRVFLAYLGQLDEAERLSATFQDGDRNEMFDQAYQQLVDLARGRHAQALEAIRALIVMNRHDQPVTSYLLAETLLAAGRAAEAAAVVPPDPDWRSEEPMEYAAVYPRLALVRARAMEQLGRKADAVKELDALLGFWKEADADLPLLVEAKAMRARLAAR